MVWSNASRSLSNFSSREDWLFSFLNGFYADSSKPTGVNNLFFRDTAMPHVLWELQGYRTLDEADLQLRPIRLKHCAGKLTQSEYEELIVIWCRF